MPAWQKQWFKCARQISSSQWHAASALWAFESQCEWHRVQTILLSGGWDLSRVVMLCEHNSQTSIREEMLLWQVSRGCKKRCRESIQCSAGHVGYCEITCKIMALDKVHTILMACIVLHKMIIEDERGEEHEDFWVEADPLLTVHKGSMPWNDYLAATRDLESTSSHFNLRNDLIEHLWNRKGEIWMAEWAYGLDL